MPTSIGGSAASAGEWSDPGTGPAESPPGFPGVMASLLVSSPAGCQACPPTIPLPTPPPGHRALCSRPSPSGASVQAALGPHCWARAAWIATPPASSSVFWVHQDSAHIRVTSPCPASPSQVLWVTVTSGPHLGLLFSPPNTAAHFRCPSSFQERPGSHPESQPRPLPTLTTALSCCAPSPITPTRKPLLSTSWALPSGARAAGPTGSLAGP